MTTRLNPYLSFRDNACEAMEFYKSIFDGELTISTFTDFHASQEPSEEKLGLHSQLESPSGVTLMGSDTPARMEFTPGNTFSISLRGEDDAELRGYWDKLSAGRAASMTLKKRPGATLSECAPTSMVWPGWSTLPAPRTSPGMNEAENASQTARRYAGRPEAVRPWTHASGRFRRGTADVRVVTTSHARGGAPIPLPEEASLHSYFWT